MKRFLISLAMVLVLAGTMAVPAMAVEQGVGAAVTVSEVIDITISDAGDNGIQFGTLDPDTADNPDEAQSTADDTTPAVTVAINPATNVNCDVSLKGTDFDATIPITGASWAGRYDDPKTYMTTSYQSVAAGVASNTDVELWLFLSIPSGAAGGAHSSTYTYQIVATP